MGSEMCIRDRNLAVKRDKKKRIHWLYSLLFIAFNSQIPEHVYAGAPSFFIWVVLGLLTLTYVHGALDDGRNDMSTTSIHVRFDRVRALLYDVENIRNRRTAMRQQATYVYTLSGAALITIILATSIGRGHWVSCGTYNNLSLIHI